MKAATQVSLEEYLNTTYRPDCDYVNGEVVERNVGDYDHADFQAGLATYLRNRSRSLGIRVLTEMRVQVTPNRVRIPDICAILDSQPKERFLTRPPFLCIEILSECDTQESIQDRIDDYLTMGVPFVWVINPRTKRGWIYTKDSIQEAKDGVMRTANPEIAVPLSEITESG